MNKPYDIRQLHWRQQLKDTYRVVFMISMVGLAILIGWFIGGAAGHGCMIGAFGVVLPSLCAGTPASMRIDVERADVDWVRISDWLCRHGYRDDARGLVPKLARPLYFDSQIIYRDGHTVFGPVLMLRKLSKVLRGSLGSSREPG